MRNVKQRFKIRPFLEDHLKQYFWITIFNSKEDLHKQLIREGDDDPKCEAISRGFEKFTILKDGTEIISHHIGNVYFYKDFIDDGIVAHELLHAALQYYKRASKFKYEDLGGGDGGDVSEEQEELCYILQRLIQIFWQKYKDEN